MKIVGVRLGELEEAKFLTDVARVVAGHKYASTVVLAVHPTEGLKVKIDDTWIGGYGTVMEVES